MKHVYILDRLTVYKCISKQKSISARVLRIKKRLTVEMSRHCSPSRLDSAAEMKVQIIREDGKKGKKKSGETAVAKKEN